MIVKAGICVAYDWQLLRYALPALYDLADQICLSIDIDRKSWNGSRFEMDDRALYEMIKETDAEKKVIFLEESFYKPDRSPISNECYQRKRMADVLGKADWIVQIDCDEIIMDKDYFRSMLLRYKGTKRPVNIAGQWINIMKQTERGFLYSVMKTPPLATNQPVYNYGRTNGHFNIYTHIFLGHISWARPEKEVQFKLQNWGHSHEFNGNSFYKIWQALDDENWMYIKDFCPMYKGPVAMLYRAEAKNIDEFIKVVDTNQHHLKLRELARNNIWISRFYKLMDMIKSY